MNNFYRLKHCRFTQYMPSKPDTFGIKFWILADVPFKDRYNIKPYLGRDELRHESLETHTLFKLFWSLSSTKDIMSQWTIFYTETSCQPMLQVRTTIFETVHPNRRDLPPPERLALYETIFYEFENLHLTRSQAKPKRAVHILPECSISYNNN